MGEIYGQIVERSHLHLGVIRIKFGNDFHPNFGAVHVFLAFVHAYTDNKLIEKRQHARHNRLVPNGEWVEASCE